MPDIIRDQLTTLPSTMLTRYKDMADGTHAETVNVEGPFNVNVTGGLMAVQGVAGGTPVNVTGTLTVTGALTDTQLRASPLEVDETPLVMARAGRGVCLKVNDKAGVNGADTVLTDAGFLYAIPAGEQVVITCFYLYLSTVSDWVWCELGYTANADGTGAFTAITPKFRIDTGNAANGAQPSVTQISPPIIVADTTGGAFTARVRTNDAGATFTLGINGWHEAY